MSLFDRASQNGSCRIGVYICHCGSNIAKMVDVLKLSKEMKQLPGVVVARQYQFMCSEPGQELIKKDIMENNLDRVVVAACSPLMHENTFRQALEDAGLNRYLFEMVNIREQVSWVTTDVIQATAKASRLIKGAIARVKLHKPLELRRVPITQKVMVVGAGIAGIEAALQMADAGYKVILVEKKASIGGHMAEFDKTFPTLDCAACILTPKMVSVGKHPNITLLSLAEVEDVEGYVGNFKVKVRKKARYVNTDVCNSCGACYEACPSRPTPEYRRMILGKKMFREGRLLDVLDKYRLGKKHDLTVLTGGQPRTENIPIPESVEEVSS